MINLEINLIIYAIIMKSLNKINLMKLKKLKMKRMKIIMRKLICLQFLVTIKNKMKIFSKIKRKRIILKMSQILTFRKSNQIHSLVTLKMKNFSNYSVLIMKKMIKLKIKLIICWIIKKNIKKNFMMSLKNIKINRMNLISQIVKKKILEINLFKMKF